MMNILSKIILISVSFTLTRSNEPELPPCPTNVQFLPQNLPMHCRMPRDAKLPGPVGAQMLQLPPFFQTPAPPDKLPNPYPMPFPPGLPGPMPMPMPMMPVPVPPSPSPKLPVIVMPFYSPDPSYKNPHEHGGTDRKRIVDIYRRPRPPYPRYDTDSSSDTDMSSDTSSGSSSDGRGWWKSSRGFKRNARRFNRRHKPKRRKHRRKELLTPVLQYVTKDGYVIYEKKISKDEAKDWLNVKKNTADENGPQIQEDPNNEVEFHEPVDEFLEAESVTETRGKNREELLDMITQQPSTRKHHPHRLKIKQHHHNEPKKEKAVS